MASNRLGWVLAVLACTGACSRGPSQAQQDSIAQADLVARRDSLAKVKAKRDSLEAMHYTTCVDSVRRALLKTPAGRRTLAVRIPAGQPRPENTAACGPLPVLLAAPAPMTGQHPAAATPATGAAPKPATPATTTPAAPATHPAATPAATPAAAPAGAPKLTPAQQRVARADSVRQVRERLHADSVARLAEKHRTDSLARVAADSVRADSLARARETEVLRETFSYAGASRDPFQSVLRTENTGPDVGDLVLVSILSDSRSARNSVAVLREKAGTRRFRVKVGDKIGNATVTLITQRDVNFSIQDFGFERQETLSLRKTSEDTP